MTKKETADILYDTYERNFKEAIPPISFGVFLEQMGREIVEFEIPEPETKEMKEIIEDNIRTDHCDFS